MPRFLWLGLVVCAIGVIAAFVFVQASAPALDVDPALVVAPTSRADAPADLVGGHDVDRDRAPIENASSVESDMWAKVRRGEYEASQSAHSGSPHFTKVEPKFDAGVIEVRVVRDHDGEPMAGVEVVRVRDGTDVQITDSRGTVVFTNVMEGRVSLSATLPGHASAAGETWIARASAHRNVELRLVVEREIVVRLCDPNGRTFEPAAWQLDRRAANRIGIRLDSRCGRLGSIFEAVDVIQFGSRSAEDELGPFTWRVRIQGFPDVCVHALLDDVIVGFEPLEAQTTELHVRLEPTAIEAALAPALVRVLADGTGAPIASALVTFHTSMPDPPKFQTSIDGRVRVSFAGAPSAEIVVSAPGYAAERLTLTRPHPPEFIVRLSAGRRIAGRVVDQDGNPLANVRVELFRPSEDFGHASGNTRSRKDGFFEFADVAAQEYRVLATAGKYRAETKVDCRERDAVELQLAITFSKPESSPGSR